MLMYEKNVQRPPTSLGAKKSRFPLNVADIHTEGHFNYRVASMPKNFFVKRGRRGGGGGRF